MVKQNPYIDHIAVMEELSDSKTAYKIMVCVAKLVSFIMKKFKWKIGMLVEFWPLQENGIVLGRNWDRGRKIALRLRSVKDPSIFLPREVIIFTILHELSHNAYMDHGDGFQATLIDAYTKYYFGVAAEPSLHVGLWPKGLDAGGRRESKGVVKEDDDRKKLQPEERKKPREKGIDKAKAPKKIPGHEDDKPKDKPRRRHERPVSPEPPKGRKGRERRDPKVCPKCGYVMKSESWWICDGCGYFSP